MATASNAQLPSSAGSTIEQMFASLRMELTQDMRELQGRTDSKLDTVQRIVRSAIEPMEQRQHIMEGNICAHDMAISEMRKQIADIKCARQVWSRPSQRSRASSRWWRRKLPFPHRYKRAGIGRRTALKVRITSKAEVALAQIEQAIRSLLEGAGISPDDVALEAPAGAKVSSK